jgi:hypothetical protein
LLVRAEVAQLRGPENVGQAACARRNDCVQVVRLAAGGGERQAGALGQREFGCSARRRNSRAVKVMVDDPTFCSLWLCPFSPSESRVTLSHAGGVCGDANRALSCGVWACASIHQGVSRRNTVTSVHALPVEQQPLPATPAGAPAGASAGASATRSGGARWQWQYLSPEGGVIGPTGGSGWDPPGCVTYPLVGFLVVMVCMMVYAFVTDYISPKPPPQSPRTDCATRVLHRTRSSSTAWRQSAMAVVLGLAATQRDTSVRATRPPSRPVIPRPFTRRESAPRPHWSLTPIRRRS